MKSDIILVGNGSSLLNKVNKELIDSYKTVVRFNSYKINGFEKYVGTKTDIWFTVNKHHFDHIKHYNKVITHSWAKTNCQLYQQFNHLLTLFSTITYVLSQHSGFFDEVLTIFNTFTIPHNS